MTTTVLNRIGHPVRRARLRHYLMCPPTYFDVVYSINPWMDPSVQVDRALAVRQWSGLVEAYRSTGHRVDLLDPLPGMVIILVASIAAIPLLIIKHFLEGPSSPALRNPCQPACPVLIAGHERSGVRSPRPIAALVRWRHRDSFLVRWEDIERLDVRRVNLRPGFTKVSSQLP